MKIQDCLKAANSYLLTFISRLISNAPPPLSQKLIKFIQARLLPGTTVQ
jgi:hypothetical protein